MMLDKLDSVSWSSVSAASGSAAAVPQLARDIATKKGPAASKARDVLAALLATAAGPAPAAVYAVPFLVELAAAKATSEREALLILLTELATGGHAARLASGDLPAAKAPDGAPKSLKAPVSAESLRAWVEAAVRESEEAYVALLGDKDEKIRAAAALLVAFTSSKPKDVAAKFAPRLHKESDPSMRWMDFGSVTTARSFILPLHVERSSTSTPNVRLSSSAHGR